MLIACVVLPALAAATFAQDAAKKSPWTPEDIVLAESAGQFRISPDGQWAVWVKSTADKEKDGRVSNLFLTSLTDPSPAAGSGQGKKEIQLTRGAENHFAPRFSPDGQLISFLSTRPLPKPNPELSRAQLWLISPFGGEPYHLTEFVRGIRGYVWVDVDTIIFSAQEDPTLWEQERKKKKDTTVVVDDTAHEPPVRLFRLAVKDKKVARLTDNTDWIEAFDVSPDGKRAVTVHAQYLSFAWDHKILPKTFVYDLEKGTRTEVFAGRRIPPQQVRWARDGAGFYALAPYSSHPQFFTASIRVAYYYDLASGTTTQVNLDWERGLWFGGFEVTADGFVALLDDGARLQPARYTKSGLTWRRANLEGAHARNLTSLVISDDARSAVYEYSTASTPEQWFRATLDGAQLANPMQITELNPGFKNKTTARTEIVRWKGALGEEVEGILYYPHNYQAGKKYPLFTAPHGGPAGADKDAWEESWAYAQQLINQRGAFVFKPNYHGSSSYGLKWVESICCGKYYEYPVEDIESGVNALIARGLVDPERIGTFGWSNGSILSIAVAVHHPERYKVLSAGAGDVEWISDWANVDFGHSFDAYYFGKSPLEDPQLYLQLSPLFKLDRVQAPTIIYFGTEDRAVPPSQGWTHYRAMYHLDKVPVKFVLFPGEPHGLQKISHQLRKLEEEMAWLDRHFFKTLAAENEAFQKSSPLAQALRRKAVNKVGVRYGAAFKPTAARGRRTPAETLIPEVVKRGELEIGRFEVTRAQFAAFDPSYKMEPGTENFPASGISFERARAYVEWLSKLTGHTWRLPQEDEVAALYEGRSGENTLDYWAGYAPNPDDAARLAAKVKELGSGAALLREVGSFAGAGADDEELIFDLGGNVAEWVIAKDGSAKTLGGSADRPADSKAQRSAAALEYTGLRVLRGEMKK
jgi:dipeptidyl aminopeptidase/acylaminoacyl peptidase